MPPPLNPTFSSLTFPGIFSTQKISVLSETLDLLGYPYRGQAGGFFHQVKFGVFLLWVQSSQGKKEQPWRLGAGYFPEEKVTCSVFTSRIPSLHLLFYHHVSNSAPWESFCSPLPYWLLSPINFFLKHVLNFPLFLSASTTKAT